MPKYKITDTTSGRWMIVSGDAPPTDAEKEELFKSNPSPSGTLPDYLKAPSDAIDPKVKELAEASANNPITLGESLVDYPKEWSGVKRIASIPQRVYAGLNLEPGSDTETIPEAIARPGAPEGSSKLRQLGEGLLRDPIQAAMMVPQIRAGGIIGQGLKALAIGAGAGALTEAENKAEGKPTNLWDIPAQGLINAIFHGGAKALTGAGSTLKDGVPDIKAAAKAAIAPKTTDKGMYLSPASVGGKEAIPQQEIERFANANATSKEIPMKLAEKNRKAMESNIGQERQLYGETSNPMSPDLRASGTDFEKSINDLSKNTQQNTIQEKKNLFDTEIEGGEKLKQASIPTDKDNMISASVQKDIVNNFDVNGVNMYAKVTKPMTNYLGDILDEAKGLKTINDLNNMRSHIYTEAVSGKWPDSRDAAALMSIGDILDQKLKASIGIALGPDKGPIAQQMLEATNQRAKDAVSVVNGVRSATSMGATKTMPDEYWRGIENIKPEVINSIMSDLDGPYKEIAAQIRAGFVDNIIDKSLNKGILSPDKFANVWSKYSKNDTWVRSLLDDKTVNAFNELADNARVTSPYLPQNINPSGTALTSETIKGIERLTHPTQWPDMLINFITKSKIKDYYKTGNINPMLTTWAGIRGLGTAANVTGAAIGALKPVAREAVSDALSYDRKRKDLGTDALTK